MMRCEGGGAGGVSDRGVYSYGSGLARSRVAILRFIIS